MSMFMFDQSQVSVHTGPDLNLTHGSVGENKLHVHVHVRSKPSVHTDQT